MIPLPRSASKQFAKWRMDIYQRHAKKPSECEISFINGFPINGIEYNLSLHVAICSLKDKKEAILKDFLGTLKDELEQEMYRVWFEEL